MDSIDDDEYMNIDWSDLSPSKSDKHQDYVFVAHIVLAVIVSILSFSGDWISWAYGTGLMTPILLVVTGIMYDIMIGINWYRDEFIPYICRTRMIPEFETDRFLKYKRMNRRTILLSGYLSLVIIQSVWSLITSYGATDDIAVIIIMLFLIFILMILLYLMVLFLWLLLFEKLTKSLYSDVEHLITLENEMAAFRHAKRKE